MNTPKPVLQRETHWSAHNGLDAQLVIGMSAEQEVRLRMLSPEYRELMYDQCPMDLAPHIFAMEKERLGVAVDCNSPIKIRDLCWFRNPHDVTRILQARVSWSTSIDETRVAFEMVAKIYKIACTLADDPDLATAEFVINGNID